MQIHQLFTDVVQGMSMESNAYTCEHYIQQASWVIIYSINVGWENAYTVRICMYMPSVYRVNEENYRCVMIAVLQH